MRLNLCDFLMLAAVMNGAVLNGLNIVVWTGGCGYCDGRGVLEWRERDRETFESRPCNLRNRHQPSKPQHTPHAIIHKTRKSIDVQSRTQWRVWGKKTYSPAYDVLCTRFGTLPVMVTPWATANDANAVHTTCLITPSRKLCTVRASCRIPFLLCSVAVTSMLDSSNNLLLYALQKSSLDVSNASGSQPQLILSTKVFSAAKWAYWTL